MNVSSREQRRAEFEAWFMARAAWFLTPAGLALLAALVLALIAADAMVVWALGVLSPIHE